MTLDFASPKRTCMCGSGQWCRPLVDARGIFCCYVCDSCEREKKSRYRPDVLTDPNYWTDEPVDEDRWF